MTAVALRVLIFLIVIGAVYLGVRRLWRDWTGAFRNLDQQRHTRDLKERKRPDVITLKRSDDGVYRPPGRDGEDGPRGA